MKIQLWIILACIAGNMPLSATKKKACLTGLSFKTCSPDELEALRALLKLSYGENVSPRFICLICGHEASRRCSLTNHMNRMHPIVEYLDPNNTVQFMCYYCKEVWSTEQAIKDHQQKKHNDRQLEFKHK
jgi:hypothetical protein